MRRIFLTILALAGFAMPALGQCPGGICPIPRGQPRISESSSNGPPVAPHPRQPGTVDDAVVKILKRLPTGNYASMGSGTFCAWNESRKEALVLTAGHVVKGEPSVAIGTQDGQTIAATVVDCIFVDGSNLPDLAMLAVSMPAAPLCATVGADVRPGEAIIKIGFPVDLAREAAIHNLQRGTPIDAGGVIIRANILFRGGDSGCGIFALDGSLCGVCSARRDFGSGLYTGARPIRDFLDKCRDSWWSRRQGQPAPQPGPAPAPRPAPQPGSVPEAPKPKYPPVEPPLVSPPAPPAVDPNKKAFDDVLNKLGDVHGKLGALEGALQKHGAGVSAIQKGVQDLNAATGKPHPLLERVANDAAALRGMGDSLTGSAAGMNEKLGKVDEVSALLNGLLAKAGGHEAVAAAVTALPGVASALPALTTIGTASIATGGIGGIAGLGWLALRLIRRKPGAAGGVNPIPATPDPAAIIQGVLAGLRTHGQAGVQVPLPPLPSGPGTSSTPQPMPPTPPQQVVHEPQYVTVTTDKSDAARAWARTQMAMKYPGMMDAVQTFDSLVDQALNATPLKG